MWRHVRFWTSTLDDDKGKTKTKTVIMMTVQ